MYVQTNGRMHAHADCLTLGTNQAPIWSEVSRGPPPAPRPLIAPRLFDVPSCTAGTVCRGHLILYGLYMWADGQVCTGVEI